MLNAIEHVLATACACSSKQMLKLHLAWVNEIYYGCSLSCCPQQQPLSGTCLPFLEDVAPQLAFTQPLQLGLSVTTHIINYSKGMLHQLTVKTSILCAYNSRCSNCKRLQYKNKCANLNQYEVTVCPDANRPWRPSVWQIRPAFFPSIQTFQQADIP